MAVQPPHSPEARVMSAQKAFLRLQESSTMSDYMIKETCACTQPSLSSLWLESVSLDSSDSLLLNSSLLLLEESS